MTNPTPNLYFSSPRPLGKHCVLKDVNFEINNLPAGTVLLAESYCDDAAGLLPILGATPEPAKKPTWKAWIKWAHGVTTTAPTQP